MLKILLKGIKGEELSEEDKLALKIEWVPIFITYCTLLTLVSIPIFILTLGKRGKWFIKFWFGGGFLDG